MPTIRVTDESVEESCFFSNAVLKICKFMHMYKKCVILYKGTSKSNYCKNHLEPIFRINSKRCDPDLDSVILCRGDKQRPRPSCFVVHAIEWQNLLNVCSARSWYGTGREQNRRVPTSYNKTVVRYAHIFTFFSDTSHKIMP